MLLYRGNVKQIILILRSVKWEWERERVGKRERERLFFSNERTVQKGVVGMKCHGMILFVHDRI